MICQNCGHDFISGNICPVCKCDALLLNKAKAASLKQYNKGVAFAQEGDYSNAIDSLNRCILFDKRNYVARNLLGIAYFEVGMTGDALKQWIISASIKSEKNPASKYIESLQKNARTLEKYNDAIVMYNRAIGQFHANCYDLAVIQLKKAVDFNPKFVEAYNLLALYHINIDDKQKAKFYIDKTLGIDKRNPKALEYLSNITSNEKSGEKKNEFKTGYNESAYRINKVKKFIRTELMSFAIGVVLTASIAFVLVVPAIKEGMSKQVNTLEEKVKKLEQENTNGTSKFALKYKSLEEEYQSLKAENEKYKQEEKNREQINNLQLANIYTESGKLAEAAELLFNLDPAVFNEADKAKIEILKSRTYSEASRVYYEEGKSLYGQGNIDSAKSTLEKSLEFGSKEDFIDNVMFILGKISEEKGDIAQAKEYYGRVLNEFSDSDMFSQAEGRLNALLSGG